MKLLNSLSASPKFERIRYSIKEALPIRSDTMAGPNALEIAMFLKMGCWWRTEANCLSRLVVVFIYI